jgi:hypothetical protein
MQSLTRRNFVKQSGLGLLTFCIAGCEVETTPRDARKQGAAMRVLTTSDVTTLEAFGEVLLPGSREAGIANYIDNQLASPAESQLLMIKYLNVKPPFEAFYREGLAALDRAARTAQRVGFHELDAGRQHELVSRLSGESPPGWDDAPPGPFYFFVVRNDALDVTYGTTEGFEALHIPYMAHILPPGRWGG